MIQNININNLYPHPDNPRKNLGDITELAESIKTRGILQNLTVVPRIIGSKTDFPSQDGYRIIIGHRRFAAAKLARLTEVPCVISDMNQHDQVATMLLENMQRSDLTIYEQAQGFQMMLDLGDSINEISERTGFSENTVRSRVRLLKFDSDKFRKSVERGGTLMDYAELDKIQDSKLRNSVLDKIGTPNFKWELQSAIDKEKNEKNKAKIIEELNKFASEVKDTSSLQYVKGYALFQSSEISKPEDAGTVKYFYQVSSSNYIYLYKESDKSKTVAGNLAQDQKLKEIQERRAALEVISKQAYQLRRSFILDFSNFRANKYLSTIIEYLFRNLFDGYSDLDYEVFYEILKIKIDDEEEDWKFDDIAPHIKEQPERLLLIATHLKLDSEGEHYYSNWGELTYFNNEELNTVYDFLEKLGYEISDEELALKNGTHKLFGKPTVNK